MFLSCRSYSGLGGSSYQVASASSAILDKLWTRVQIEPLSKEELTEVSTVNNKLYLFAVLFFYDSIDKTINNEHKQLFSPT